MTPNAKIATWYGRSSNKNGGAARHCFALLSAVALSVLLLSRPAFATCPYDPNCLNNPYGAGSPYAPNGLMNPYSPYGSPYSNQSWTNPYATQAPRLYDQNGNFRGNLSANIYDPDSVSNPYGRYGSPYSADSPNNPYGAGNPYSGAPLYVVPRR
ncbi:hypothetical protein SAMN05444161_5343 [Rhizobiales bacterium GAS191]|nr:hypothetical protein SAMN05444161_5343 [Rhizobiales bacterium GAS191]